MKVTKMHSTELELYCWGLLGVPATTVSLQLWHYSIVNLPKDVVNFTQGIYKIVSKSTQCNVASWNITVEGQCEPQFPLNPHISTVLAQKWERKCHLATYLSHMLRGYWRHK